MVTRTLCILQESHSTSCAPGSLRRRAAILTAERPGVERQLDERSPNLDGLEIHLFIWLSVCASFGYGEGPAFVEPRRCKANLVLCGCGTVPSKMTVRSEELSKCEMAEPAAQMYALSSGSTLTLGYGRQRRPGLLQDKWHGVELIRIFSPLRGLVSQQRWLVR